MLTIATARIKKLFSKLSLIFLTLLFVSSVNANNSIPDELKKWESWVLKDSPSSQCPFLYNNNKNICAYPDSLTMNLKRKSANFNQVWHVYAQSWVTLPGDHIHWPKNVKVNGKAHAVISRNNKPVVRLNKGRYDIVGNFSWHQQPKSISIPEETGIVKLKINQQNIPLPDLRNGKLWLKSSNTKSSKNNYLDIQIYRKIIDTIPLRVVTHINLNVAGQQRELKLDGALLDSFKVASLSGRLPAQIDNEGKLKIQIRPGRWQIEVTSYNTKELKQLTLPNYNKSWPKDELWVLDHQAHLRLIKVIDKNSIDPNQTQIPHRWKTLPAYSMKTSDSLKFDVIKRGNPEPEPNQLSLTKKIWLDFNGEGYTINDKINGKLSRDWRLNASEVKLGQVTLNGKPQPITEDKKQQGVEVRHGQLNLSADSRIDGGQRTLSASGWDINFNKVKATLYLPAGWKLISLNGANSNKTWLKRWTLLDLFMVLITAIAIYKLFGLKWGVVTLITLALAWHTRNSPQYIWINLIIVIAVLRVLPEGRFYNMLNNYRLISSILLVLIILPFMVDQVRTTLYPQLEFNYSVAQSPNYYAGKRNIISKPASIEEEMQEPARSLSLSDTKARFKQKVEKHSLSSRGYELKKVARIDPDAMIQTGPGLPSWTLHRYPLSWDGPVRKGQTISMLLLSPVMQGVFKILQMALIILLAWKLIDVSSLKLPTLSNTSKKSGVNVLATVGLLGLLLVGKPTTVDAAYPSQALLNELKQELIKPAKCLPHCASIESMNINLLDNNLTIKLRIHTEEDVLLPLPIPVKQWIPSKIDVDGKQTSGLVRHSKNNLWLHSKKGSHTVNVTGSVTHLNQLQFDFPLKPYDISLKIKGWTAEGMEKATHKIESLTFLRKVDKSNQSDITKDEQSDIPVYAQVTRSLQLGLEWIVTTHVQSLSGTAFPVILNIPLLKGESVITDNITVKNNHAVISLNNNRSSYSWTSKLEIADKIELQASQKENLIEKWGLDASPVWHINLSGIPVIYHKRRGNNWRPEWQPWPNEKVIISVTKPFGVAGKTLTIDSSTLSLTPGAQITTAKLNFNLRSSLGGQHVIQLPKEADLQTVKINNQNMPIRNTAEGLSLPVNPGNQKIEISWQEDRGISNVFHSSNVNLGSESVNNAINIKPGYNRWLLYTSGPSIGPAILFWGMLVVIILISYGLGLTKGTPLNSLQWVLLGFGLSASGPWGLVIVAVCIFALRARGNLNLDNISWQKFNVIQVGLFLLVFVTVSTLLSVIEQGLLGSPDMQIQGNGSSAYQLNWFSDRINELIPSAMFISVPIYVFRLLMLVWSIWLAFAVVKWAQWSWSNYAKGGYWRSKPVNKNINEEKNDDLDIKKLE